MVKLKILSKDSDKFANDSNKKIYFLSILLEDIEIPYLNAIRRCIYEHVPTLAIEELHIYDNNSVMWDEFLAHRMGLLPIHTPKDIKNLKLKAHLEKEGPGFVYSDDIKFEDKEIYIPYPKIPIVYLEKSQKIKCDIILKESTGKEHIKWSPGLAYYYNVVDIEVIENLSKDEKERLKELNIEIKGKSIKVPEDKKYDRTFIDAIISINPNKLKEKRTNKFVFNIESFGQKSAKDIFLDAISILKNKLSALQEKL